MAGLLQVEQFADVFIKFPFPRVSWTDETQWIVLYSQTVTLYIFVYYMGIFFFFKKKKKKKKKKKVTKKQF